MAKLQPTTSPAKPAETGDPKVGKLRSPNYPVIDLGKAVEKAKLLHEAYRTAPVSVPTAALKLGYKADSSVGGQTIAAMRAFGLIGSEGSGSSRKVRVSADGEKIILNHPSRPALLQTAALTPRIHRELWDKFFAGKAAPDPDTLISHYLQWDRVDGKFNPESIAPLIAQFKRTITFARLDSSAMIPVGASEDIDADDEPMNGTAQIPSKPTNPSAVGTRAPDDLPLPLILPDGSIRVVAIPRMDESTFAFFKTQLEAYKSAIVRAKAASSGDPE